MENKKAAAREMFVKITQSSMFTSGEGSEQIQRTLRYNVHKNLGECFMEEESWAEAEDNFFLATKIDRTDVTLWWQLGKKSYERLRTGYWSLYRNVSFSFGVCEAW